MPRDGSNVYSAPPGTKATTDTTIASSPYNALVADLVADANAARPITAGGTGATTAVGASDALSTRGTAIASATSTDIGAATGRVVHVTGTTTITGLGTTSAGVERLVVFDGVLTLTHNATSLILPGAANITTAAGDTAIMVSEGSGNWKCISFQRAAGMVITTTDAASQVALEGEAAVGYVRPSHVKYSPGVAKCWVHCGIAGNIYASYGVSSVTDNAAGDLTINQSVTMGANNGPIIAMPYNTTGFAVMTVNSYTDTSFRFYVWNSVFVKADAAEYFAVRYGDLP